MMPLHNRCTAFRMEISSDLSFPELPLSLAISEPSVWIQAGDREHWPKIAPSRDLSGKLSARGAELSTEMDCTAS
jgi:hypothetical protein